MDHRPNHQGRPWWVLALSGALVGQFPQYPEARSCEHVRISQFSTHINQVVPWICVRRRYL